MKLAEDLTATSIALLLLSSTSMGDLLITEVVDGPLTGGQPKWTELTNTGTASVILGGFSLGVKNNGTLSLSNGAAMTLSGNLPAGASFVVAFEPDNGPGGSTFFSVYGQDPDAYSTSSINGDDTILLYLGDAVADGSNATLVDIFGVNGTDGTGTSWEYTDSYASRCGSSANAGIFSPSDWDLPGPGALMIGCNGDDVCETANLIALTTPWSHPGCTPTGTGTLYCPGDQGACPCGNDNDGSLGESGCANSASPGGAQLRASGSASISAANLQLVASGLPPSQVSLCFQGNNAINSGSGIPFGGGLRCAGGAAIRLQVMVSDATGVGSSTINIGSKGAATPGALKRYQLWYADQGILACGDGFNLTNALEVVWEA